MKPTIITLEAEPDGSFVHTIEVIHDDDTVYVQECLGEDGMPFSLRAIFIPVKHAEVVARAILRAAGLV
jgi:hypothetical protein